MGRTCIRLAQCLLVVMAMNALLSVALAGTETGEFCPTCPDWTDLDGWLAKKDAYERAQMNGVQQPIKTGNGANVNAANMNANTNAAEVRTLPAYPKKEIMTSASTHPSFDGLVLLDVRSPEDYQRGHIPGARNIYWTDLTSDDALDVGAAKAMLEAAGINNSDSVLIYGDEDEGADFVFWAMSYLGHANLSKLDGGVDAAWSAGIVPDGSIPQVTRSNYTIQPADLLLVNKNRLGPLLKQPDLQILDARDFADYGMSRLTNASIPFDADKLTDDSRMKDFASLEELMNRRGLEKNGTVLVYGTPKAYSLFFGLDLMGYNATLLEGDWWQKTKWAVSNVR